jgi:hypothetical protein
MKIHNTNPIAAQALWGALVAMADSPAEACVCHLKGTPYSVRVTEDNGHRQHLVISAANASYRVSRIECLDDSVEYVHAEQSYFGKAIHKHFGWGEGVDAVTFLTGLIEYIQVYRSFQGVEIREELAFAEVKNSVRKTARLFFRNHLEEATDLQPRKFFNQDDKSLTDIQQLIEGYGDIKPGTYRYASLSGQNVNDTILVVTEAGTRAVLNLDKDNHFKLLTKNPDLLALVDLAGGGINEAFVNSLIGVKGYARRVLNTVEI